MTALQTPLDGSPPDAVTAPPLTREAARAVIARRLRALDHPPDLLDNQAVAALIDHASGSGMQLRAALAATLFLASTEDAPRIGRSLVQRALQETGDIQPAPASVAPQPWRRFLVPGGAVLACSALAVTLLVLRPSHRPEPVQRALEPSQTVVAQADRAAPVTPPAENSAASPPTSSTAPTSIPVLEPPSSVPVAEPPPVAVAPFPSSGPVTPSPAPVPAPVPAPAPAAAQSATAPLSTAPKPPAEPPAPVPPDLPSAPPASIVLMVSGRDPASALRLDSLMQHLRAAGIGQVVMQPSSAARARRPVSYFFADDLPLAQRITQVLANEGWPHLSGNSLAPRLVIPPSGMPPRQPGLIEIQLP